ncbi:MAG: pyridoxamine 5'-phosphate oxidase family protein [Allomuricauda sp.]
MNLNTEIIKYIDGSILCWLATVSSDGVPNVSPKEIFDHQGENTIIVANIASPQTVKNIQQNENVCISFIDVLVQKGFQLKGKAKVIDSSDSRFLEMEKVLLKKTGGNFPFKTITVISIDQAKQIIAPKYVLYPNTTEAEQIADAKRAYGIK